MDSFEISLFDELDACYACGHDANMNDAYEDELAIVPYVTHDDFDEYNMHVLAAPTCNYYERGTISPPLYVSNMIKLQETIYTMHWPFLGVHALFLYDMPMHRKRVRLRCCMIYVTLCSPLNCKSLLIKTGFDIPWDPGGSIT